MTNVEESEIKIEYYQTLDVDPLLGPEVLTENNIAFNAPINGAQRNLNKEVLAENTATNDIEIPVKTNDFKEPEAETKWHKLVTSTGKYVCKFCNLTYSTVQTLRNHVRHKHTENYDEIKNKTINSLRRKILKCHICSAKYTQLVELQNHVQSHGLNNIKNSCPICLASFETDTEISYHLKTEHKTEMKLKHVCNICGYVTQKLSHFKQHENTHKTNNKEKCSYCDYSTNYPSNLKIHKRIHESYKLYVCGYEQCDYRCSTKSGLTSHELRHDKQHNILYCDKCSYNTVYKQTLKKHIESHSRNSVRKR